MDYAPMSLDDLDENLFAVELSNYEVEKQEQPTVPGGSRRRPWHWKHTLPTSVDKKDVGMGKIQFLVPLESSRRGSVCSSQSSPIKASPKKSKDQQSKKATFENKDDVNQKVKKDCGSFLDDKLDANTHLYNVLEEKVLGEIIRESMENVYTKGNRLINFCTTALSATIWYFYFSYNTKMV